MASCFSKLNKKSRRNLLWFLPLFLLVAYGSVHLLTSNKSASDNTVEANNLYGQNGINSDSDKPSDLNKSKEIIKIDDVNKEATIDKNDRSSLRNNSPVRNSINKEILNSEIETRKDIDDLSRSQENDEVGFTKLQTSINNRNIAYESKQSKKIENKSTTSAPFFMNTYEKEQSSSRYVKGLKDQIGESQESRQSLEFPHLNPRSMLLNTNEKFEIQLIPITTLRHKRDLKFRIGTGVFYEVISQDSLTDNANIGFQSNLNISYSKMHLNLGYKNNKIDRVILSQFESYNIYDSKYIYGFTSPDSASLTYTNHIFDLTMGYNFSPIKWIDWNIQAGILARYIKNGKIIYTYGGAYEPEPIVIEFAIENQKFKITDFILGTGFHFKAYKSIGLSIEYNLIIPRDTENIKWPRRHQFELGLFYNLN